jgi:Tol biopolymer transport system component
MTRAAVMVLALALAFPTVAAAFHRRTPQALQVTPNGAGAIDNVRWSGYRYVLFDSDADLLENGSTGRQVFVFDLQERDKHGTLALHQVTTGAGDSRRASMGRRGRTIVYDARPGGQGARQLFLVDRNGGAPRALTAGAGDSMNACMDDGGAVVVFESNGDLLNNGVAGTQIYRIDLVLADGNCPYPCPANGNSGLTQITRRPGTSRNAVTSRLGSVIVFESDADLLDTGDTETQVYMADTRNNRLVALSHGPGASRNPALSRNGVQVAFESDADLAGTGTGGTQIFLYRRPDTPIEQITFAPGAVSERPSLSSKGKGLIFISTGDLLGAGSSGPEVYTYDVANGGLRQITNTPGMASEPAYSEGVFTTFVGDGDLLGTGASGEELYVVNLFKLQGELP